MAKQSAKKPKPVKLNPVRENPESGQVRQRMTRDNPNENHFIRDFRIDRAAVNEKDRTVSLAFSSETPVERWDGNEVLSHAAGDYDFSRLNDSHPLLLGHAEYDPSSQIGVVVPGSAKVGDDRVGRCDVQFSRSALGE
ncbi:MAG: hypothetical protein KGL39_59465, partial [Patescibacteria group bacterium]|nr:hypothetical protein [Patescibacteria group bacterium]